MKLGKVAQQIKLKNKFLKRFGYVFVLLAAVSALVLSHISPTSAAPGPISGSVFNDVNANGVKDAGEGAFSNLAIVNLYNSSGTYVKSRTSDNNGNFSLSGLAAGTYYISLYNTNRAGALNSPPGLINDTTSKVEQTYGSVGAGAGTGSGPVCVSAAPDYTARGNYTSSPSEWATGAQNGTSSGQCFGGRKADMSNTVLSAVTPLTYPASTDFTTGNAGLNTQKSVSKVVLTSNGGVSNVDFGMSANAVTNTNASGQGSMSQFITNANATGGTQAMRFVPSIPTNQGSGSNAWWQINQGTTPLPSITNPSTTLDGRAWSNTNGTTQLNTNTGTIGGASVGTVNYPVGAFQKPELELVGDVRGSGGTSLISVAASNVTVANLGLNSTVNYPAAASQFILQTAGVGMTVNDNVMGVNVATGSNYSTRPQNAITTAYLLSLNATGLFKHNYISSADARGVGLSNAVSLVLGDWIIEENDGPSAGVSFGAGTTRITVRHNNMPEAWLDAAPLSASLGFHFLTENTISGGNGVKLYSSSQNTITKNIIKNATGTNPGVGIANLSTGNYVSQNSFSGNGGNSIDLNTDGVSENSLVQCLTLSPELVSLANLGIARPTISNARLQGSTLKVDIGYCALGVFDVELYKASAGSGDSNAGEGATYLGTFTDLNLIAGVLPNQTMTVNGLQAGDQITALVVDRTLGNTSEFSPNATAASPPSAPTSAPDMTAATDTGDSNTDNLTSNATPTFTGSCTTGETVTLYIDDVAVTPTQVCSGGTYSITPSNAIASGNHTVTSTFTNATGESAKSPSLAFTIDTTPPTTLSAPDMTAATDTGSSNSDNITSNTKPVFTGSCTTGEMITLYVDGALVGTQVCSGGQYSIQPTNDLTAGSHSVTVKATDAAGNQSVASSALAITVDISAPAAPVISSPSNNSSLNDNTPTFSGTGENGATVTVKDENGTVVCTAVMSGGNWSCDASPALTDGSHTFTATQVDAAGNTSSASLQVTATIDTVAPLAPVIISPPTGSATSDTTPTIAGTADPNNSVKLVINGQAPITVQADSSGNWSYTPASPLAQGNYTVSATQVDAAGNVSPASTNVSLTIDTDKPTVTVNKKAGQADPTTDNSAIFTVTFSEAITASSFSPSDVAIGTSPTTNAVFVSNFTQINATTWEVTLTGMPNHTTVSASLAADAVTDAAGNTNVASTSTDNNVLYEVNVPNVVAQITNDTTPTLTGECLSGHQHEIVLSGPASQTLSATCNGSGIWTATASALPDGTYNVAVTDTTAGLTNPADNQTDALVIDTIRPAVTVNQAVGQADPTNANSAEFLITFSKPIVPSSFTNPDLTLGGTSGSVAIMQLTATTWKAVVTGMASGDNVTLSLSQNKVEDMAGNGNTQSTSTDNTVTFDSTPPAAPAITSPADNAVINTPSAAISGTGENGATVAIEVDGVAIACTNTPVVVSGGTWSCTPAQPLAEGEHSLTSTQTDPAGNTSPVSSTITVTVDTVAPAIPGTPSLTAASDTGSSNSDGITKNQTVTLTGVCTAPATIKLFDGQTQIASGACSGGTYTFTVSSPLSAGQHTLTATATDAAGNVSSASSGGVITIDTAVPGKAVITSPPNNSVQNNGDVTLAGTGEVGASITMLVNGSEVACDNAPIIVDGSGAWSCVLTDSLSDGDYTITAVQTDVAGNAATASDALSITVDTTPPTALSTPVLSPSSDTGSSNSDRITNATSPVFTGSCQNGTTVKLYVNGTVAGQASCSGGVYSAAPSTPLTEGSYTVTVTATDAAGNESAPSAATEITLDTTPPASLSAPAMTAATDTGSSNSDKLTNNTSPHFTGNCTSGNEITIYIDGALAGQASCSVGAAYDIAPSSPLSEGQHVVTVTATDIAGNQSTISSGTTITIDTASPATPAITSPTNNQVSNQPNIVVTGTGDNDMIVELLVDGSLVACSEGEVVVNNGTWSCTSSQALSDGQHTITVRLRDAAGNASSSASSRTITIDTTAPTTPAAPDLDAASDTGNSNTDNITNDTTPTLTGSCSGTDTIRLYIDGVNQTKVTCQGGAYSLTSPLVLSDGTHAFTVMAIDPVGNASAQSTALNVTIVTAKPTASSTDMTAGTDTGRSNTDDITSDTTPTFSAACINDTTITLYLDGTSVGSATCASSSYTLTGNSALSEGEHHATITVTDIAGNVSDQSPMLYFTVDTSAPTAPTITAPTEGLVTSNTTPVLQGTGENNAGVAVYLNNIQVSCSEGAIVVVNSSWSCTPSSPLADNTYILTAILTDVAGNVSTSSADRTFTIDTTAPNAPGAPDMTAATDTGASNTDNVTNNKQPVFTGSCTNGFTVKLYASGTEVASATCSGGSYSLQPSTALADGTYNMTVRTIDLAGNASADSGALSITIETTPPPAPPQPDMASSSDSGASNSDNLTNNQTPHFTGSCDAGTTVRLWIDGAMVGQAACSGGTFDVAPSSPLADGSHEVRLQFVDAAGNEGLQSAPITITIDSTPPPAPGVSNPQSGSTTSDNTPTFEGTGENGAAPTVTVNSTSQTCGSGSTPVVINGQWTCTTTTPLPDGTHNGQAEQTDPAGNTSTPTTFSFSINSSAPAAPAAPDLLAASDSGASNSDNYTSVKTPTFTGTCTAETIIKLYANALQVGEVSCTNGTYSLTSTQTLADGTYQFTVIATNASGVVSPASPALAVTIDTVVLPAPGTPDMTAATDTGFSNSDNITSSTQPHFTGTCSNTTLELRQDGTHIAQGTCSGGTYELVPASGLANGTYQVAASYVSQSGVRGQESASLSFTVDTQAPTAPVISVPTEGTLTNNNKPTLSGSGETGAQLQLYANNSPITCSQGSPLVVTGGVWTCTPVTALPEGAVAFKATQTDPAANISAESAVKNITVDTTAPARPGRPDLTAATDSGVSNTDNVTNITSPILVGTCINGDTVRLRMNTAVVSQMVCSGGNYSLSVPSPLADATYAFSVVAVDPAGNVSAVSLSLNVTIRTQAAKPSLPDLHVNSDSGLSSIDNITNVTLPTITGICNQNETVRMFMDGVLQQSVPCVPPFYAQPQNQLSPGNHSVTIQVIDIAGNTSGMSDTLVITIDNMAPGNPTVANPAQGSTPVVTTSSYTTTGTNEPNSQIVVWENDVRKCEAMSNSSGAWSCTLTGLTNGTHNYVFSTTDLAGNSGPHIVTRSIQVSQ